jgi:hypothetical protein
MCLRFRKFASGTVSTPTLYGLSTFGPQFCVYTYDSATRSVDPTAIARDLAIINDTAPEARWMFNLLEEAGEAKLRDIVNAVKGMAAAL